MSTRTTPLLHQVALAGLLAVAVAIPVAATCGGGGGGGMGGLGRPEGAGRGGGGSRPLDSTYHTPWSVVHNGDEVPPPGAAPGGAPVDNLVLYWFPTDAKEAQKSDLQQSRDLTLATTRCVTLALVPTDNADLRGRFAAADKGAAAVLADASGKVLGRVAAAAGERLKAGQVEKLVSGELKSRESAAGKDLDAARAREKQGDAAGAADLYQKIWAARCLVPGGTPGKAADALKRLGHPVTANAADLATVRRPAAANAATGERVARAMAAGLTAEDAGRYRRARDLYVRANRLDPADPVPLRYLGELYRHHLGDWVEARRIFNQVLAMPADPISRAAAFHGLGKMTIHDGDFAHGLALIERSIATYPLPLAYRNLAVYWNSEGQVDKARGFAEQALALDPEDPYTQIFVAAFIAEDGRREEALRIAHANEDLLAASYNLAAIQCLLGHRDLALALLRRHFYEYERYDAVRSKEMKEAREDIVFTALKQDPDFIALTAMAEKPADATTAAPAVRMPGAGADAATQKATSGLPR